MLKWNHVDAKEDIKNYENSSSRRENAFGDVPGAAAAAQPVAAESNKWT